MLDRTTTFPATKQETIQAVYLMLEDGRCLSRSFRCVGGLNSSNSWSWIVGNICGEFDCHPDQVSTIETDDGERIAVDGKPVAEVIVE